MRTSTLPRSSPPPAAAMRPSRHSSRHSTATSAKGTWPWPRRYVRSWRHSEPRCRKWSGSSEERRPMIVSVLTRRLKDGKTYADFRAAWKPDKGFGVSTRVVTGQGLEDPREIVTIGFSDLEPDDVPA